MSRTTSLLASFSTCELSDALIKLSVTHGGHIPGIHAISPGKICSPAYPVKIVLAADTDAPRLSGGHFVDGVASGHVLVIDAPKEASNAVWGGLMSAGALARGATGVVISGNCRDIAEHRALAFPVYSRSHSTLGQAPFTRPSTANEPITIHTPHFPDVTINPGDWIVADEDGVVCVPAHLEQAVLELAEKGRAIDELCMADIRAGKGVQASFKLHRGK